MKKVGEYVLLSELGKGQFGVVYKAKNCNTGDIYAIKSVLKSSINNSTKLKTLFNTEISIMSRIKHPNILHLYEYLETNNNYYLVIDFCNNGDMETHVKKHTFLGEEESVYFLMQIMNGFKELHEHKIMHRDFKLANLFLNDDKLIIGDFGFARSGVDMTSTKLGSPITMAPELLLSPPGAKLVYTNKADLWSIGVCFYQMIFGQLPWDVSELEDLKHKVQYQSGSKLHFPTDKVQISPECRDLLIKILEVDAKKRIEWEDLFNHKLFAMHEAKKNIKDAALNMRQSVMFRNNEDNVKKLFDQNKKEDMKEVELEADPDNLNINTVATQAEPVQDAQVVLNRIKTRVISRYTHEKKTIVFFMYTCRRLRNLAKDRDLFKNGSDNLMYAAILLLKKGMIMNDAAVSSLKNETNIYSIEGFEQFAALPDRVRLVDELESKDTHLYNKLFSHLKDKVTEECTASDPRRELIMHLVTSSSCTIQAVDQELKKECSYLIPYFFKSSSGLSTHQRFELMLSLAHTYVSAYQEEYLSYSKEGVPFDWNEYEKSWNGPQGSEKINAILSKAISAR